MLLCCSLEPHRLIKDHLILSSFFFFLSSFFLYWFQYGPVNKLSSLWPNPQNLSSVQWAKLEPTPSLYGGIKTPYTQTFSGSPQLGMYNLCLRDIESTSSDENTTLFKTLQHCWPLMLSRSQIDLYPILTNIGLLEFK